MDIEKNYYDVLDVPPTASPDEVRQVWKKWAEILHPDKIGQSNIETWKKAGHFYAEINHAYDVIKNADTRAQLDAFIAAQPDYELTPYELLGVSSDALAIEIKIAFEALQTIFGRPQILHHDDEWIRNQASAQLVLINAAYEQVNTTARRAEYDASFGTHCRATENTTPNNPWQPGFNQAGG